MKYFYRINVKSEKLIQTVILGVILAMSFILASCDTGSKDKLADATATEIVESSSVTSFEPTPKQTIEPTVEPTATPTLKPTQTLEPTPTKTESPSPKPTSKGTARPTIKPTLEPTPEPTEEIKLEQVEKPEFIQTEEKPDYSDFIPIGALAINEAMYVNDTFLKQSDGKCYDWVELKNISNNDINLSNYIITDKLTKMKCKLPDKILKPGELFVLICSSKDKKDKTGYYHTNFSLSSSGDGIYIYDLDGILIDAAYLTDIPYAGSYGRMTVQDGYYYFTKPTPGKNNTGGIKNVCAAPVSNYPSGVYNKDSMQIELKADGKIYFTTDGSTPTNKSAVYTTPFKITTNKIIRTIVYKNGSLPSEVKTFSYILDHDSKLPVLSLAVAPDDLWSDETGIYVKGKYENYYQNWEKSACLSYYGGDGTFSINCGLKMNGAGSRETDKKKSFKVIFRGKYGAGTLKCNLFNNGINEFDSLILRAGEDYPSSIVRNEAAVRYAAKYLPSLVTQTGKHCSLYINGKYFGIYYLMERVTEKFVAEHFNVPEDDVIIEEYSPSSSGELNSIMNFARNNDLTIAKNYEYIKSKIDIESMTDWFIYQAYTGNTDATANIRYVKPGKDAKWKWVAYDFDWTFYTHEKSFQRMLTKNMWYTSRIIQPLLKNPSYRIYFIERFSQHAKNLFNSPQKFTNIVDELCAVIKPEVARERALWGGSVKSWEKSVKSLKGFVTNYNRCQELKKSLAEVLSMTAAEKAKYF